MRTVLVCVRTPLAAQTVASTAARLGMTGVVRTAVSETEAMIRLAERPAEVVLADTAVTRPDSVGFTRRVLARAPQAQVVLFGAEDPRVAAAATRGSSAPNSTTCACGARARTRRVKPTLSGRVTAVSARTTSAGRSAKRIMASVSLTAVRTTPVMPSRAAVDATV